MAAHGVPDTLDAFGGLERANQQVHHHLLDLVGRNHPGGAAAVAVPVVRLGDVVAVLLARGLLAVGDVVLATVGPIHQPAQQGIGFVPGLGFAHSLVSILAEDGLHPIPQLAGDDRLVLASEYGIFVANFADVDGVAQEFGDVLFIHRRAIARAAVLQAVGLGGDPFQGQFPNDVRDRLDFRKSGEDAPNGCGVLLLNDQLAVFDLVAQWRVAPHPQALAFAGGDLVADAFARDLALELGEGQQDVEHQPAHRRGGVELLGHRHERHLVPFEHLHQLGKVGQAARQAVDLVDDHDVNLVGNDVRHQAFQSRAFHVAARVTTIVVVIAHRQPALSALADDIGLACLALGIQRIERLIEAFVRRDAGVDGAALFGHDGVHLAPRFCLFLVIPKNSGPDHWVPVM